MASIIRKELKLLIKGKGNFFFLILMPMLFIALFGAVFSGLGNSTVAIDYVNQDNTALTRTFLHDVGSIKGFALQEEPTSSLASQIQKVKDGKTASLLVIPKGFGARLESGDGSAALRLYVDPTSDSVSGPIESALNVVANAYRMKRIASVLVAAGRSPNQIGQILRSPIAIHTVSVSGSGMTMLDQVVPGYTVMFVFFIILSMMRSFLGEKESGMLSRLRTTSLRPWHYLIGMWIPAIIAVLIQCVILLAFGHFVFGIHLGDLTAIALLVISLAICGTGIGLAISLLVRGENQGRGITMLIAMGGAALGGLWVPSQLMPPIVQTIGRFTPQYWAQQGFQDVMLRGGHVGSTWQMMAVLLAFGVIGLMVALLRFRSFMRTATN